MGEFICHPDSSAGEEGSEFEILFRQLADQILNKFLNSGSLPIFIGGGDNSKYFVIHGIHILDDRPKSVID